jgi:hypothetical protein
MTTQIPQRMSKRTRLLLAGVAAGSLSLVTTTAGAHPLIREEVRLQLAMKVVPPCGICHEHGNTGRGSVHTPFGLSMRMHGLDVTKATDDGERSDNVFNTIAKMKADHVDSDGDGIEDITELENGTNPNVPGAVPLVDDPAAGCQCALAGRSPAHDASFGRCAALAGLAVVGVISVRRATRRARPSRA